MRSHKYQAKCINPKGQWVEGSLLIFSNDSAAIIPSGSVIFHPYEKSYQLVVKECVIVDPNTVSQATDYQDVYGNTIFENHILTDGILQILILWDREKGGWMYETASGARYNFNQEWIGRFRIIGNKFDYFPPHTRDFSRELSGSSIFQL